MLKKIGIIGFGNRGKYFLTKALESKMKVYLYSNHLSSYPDADNIILCSSLEELVFQKPDLIIISSADKLHYEYAVKAIKARIPTLIEKPSTASFLDTQKLLKLSKKENVQVFIGYNHRTGCLYPMTKKLLPNIEEIQSIHCNIFTNVFETLNQTNALFLNVASHYVDCLNYLLKCKSLEIMSSTIFLNKEKEQMGNVSAIINNRIPFNISFNFSSRCFPEICESSIYIHTTSKSFVLSRNSLKIISEKSKIEEYFEESDVFFESVCSVMKKGINKNLCTLEEDCETLRIFDDIYKKTIFKRDK